MRIPTTGLPPLPLPLLLGIALFFASASGCTRDWSKYGEGASGAGGGEGVYPWTRNPVGSACAVPGERVFCLCDGALTGAQTCLADRTYGPCDCGAGLAGYGAGLAGYGAGTGTVVGRAGAGGYAGTIGEWGVAGGYPDRQPSYDAGRFARCGNGIIDLGEQCDGLDLNGATCSSLEEGDGRLSCGPACLFDVSMCTIGGPYDYDGGRYDAGGYVRRCGNGVIDFSYGEQCDGSNLNGATCWTLGWDHGTLLCDPSNCRYDYRYCKFYGYYDDAGM